MTVTLVGGPEDGREVDVQVARLEELPPQINVAAMRDRLTAFERTDPGDLHPTGRAFLVHVYRREAQRLGPLTRVRYVYEGTS